ncbi:hypothetical protein HN451_04535, partial [archaeon]|nr:hypothetical protein [archaeon]
GWNGSVHEKEGKKYRNCAITAIAPTGTLSMVADTSGGCEPNFALAFMKNSHSLNQTFTYVNKHFEEIAKKRGFYSEELMEKIANQGTLDGLDEVPDDVKKIFEVAFNVPPESHIMIQSSFQKNVSNAVSKTINFPNDATIEEVKEGYMLAWEKGCKGCTVYRDGSRQNQVLNIKSASKEKSKIEEKEITIEETDASSQEVFTNKIETLATISATDGTVTTEIANEALKSEPVPIEKKEDMACRIQIVDGRIVKTCE